MCSDRQAGFEARITTDPQAVKAAQRLRHRAFIEAGGAAGREDGLDADGYDEIATHCLIHDRAGGDLVGTFRFLALTSGAEIGRSYSAQHYDLAALTEFNAPMVEIGRFCVAPGRFDPGILRAAWGAMTAFVDREGVGMLFGCSSFQGTDSSAYVDAFAMLRDRHLAPARFGPRVKAPNVFRFAARLRRPPDRVRALKTMPPLLRSYLAMGGWVSDHAVVDNELNTLHVFTGLEIGRIPAARARVLRAVAG